MLSNSDLQVTLSQGRVEDVFVASMKEHGVSVEWDTVPTSIRCSTVADELKDPQAYANTVRLALTAYVRK